MKKVQPPTESLRPDLPQRAALAEAFREHGAPRGLMHAVADGHVPLRKARALLALRALNPGTSWSQLRRKANNLPAEHSAKETSYEQ